MKIDFYNFFYFKFILANFKTVYNILSKGDYNSLKTYLELYPYQVSHIQKELSNVSLLGNQLEINNMVSINNHLCVTYGSSIDVVETLVNAGYPLSSDALRIASGYSVNAVKTLVNAGCPLSSDALCVASGFSVDAVQILVNAGCPLSSDALRVASGFSKKTYKILLIYKFKLIIKKTIYELKKIKYFLQKVNLHYDLIEIIKLFYFRNIT